MGAELQRTQVAPEADAFTFSQIASHDGVAMTSEDLSAASATDILASLREVTSDMDEKQVSTGSRILFITLTLKGVLDDFSYASPTRSNRMLERFSRVVEAPQVRFCAAIDLLSGGDLTAIRGGCVRLLVGFRAALGRRQVSGHARRLRFRLR